MTDRLEPLRQLRRVIRNTPADKLHMRSFTEESACGTVHCAAGWAACDPWFQEHTAIAEAFHITPDKDDDGNPVCYVRIKLEEDELVAALGKVFGLRASDVDALFGLDLIHHVGPHAVTKKEVLDNIVLLLAGGHAVEYQASRRPHDFGTGPGG